MTEREDHHSAGVVSRALAMLVDIAVLAVTIASTAWLVDRVEGIVRPYAKFDFAAAVAPAAPVIGAAYFVLSWALFGQTIGKALFGIRVEKVDGGDIRLPTALLRLVGYLVSAVPLYLGFVWVLVDPARRAWHDRLSGTRVVYVVRQHAATPSVDQHRRSPADAERERAAQPQLAANGGSRLGRGRWGRRIALARHRT